MTRICTSAALLLLLACAASATIVKPNLPLSATGPKAEIHDFFKPSHTTFKPVKTSPEEPEEPLITPPEEPVDTPEPVHLEPEHGASISLSELPEHSVIHPERPVTDPVGSTGKDVSLLKKFEKNREALFAKIGEHKDSISLPEVFEHSVIDPKRPVTEPVDSTGKDVSLLEEFEQNREDLLDKIDEHKDSISLPEVFERSAIDPKRSITGPVDPTGKHLSLLEKFEKRREALFAKIDEHLN